MILTKAGDLHTKSPAFTIILKLKAGNAIFTYSSCCNLNLTVLNSARHTLIAIPAVSDTLMN